MKRTQTCGSLALTPSLTKPNTHTFIQAPSHTYAHTDAHTHAPSHMHGHLHTHAHTHTCKNPFQSNTSPPFFTKHVTGWYSIWVLLLFSYKNSPLLPLSLSLLSFFIVSKLAQIKTEKRLSSSKLCEPKRERERESVCVRREREKERGRGREVITWKSPQYYNRDDRWKRLSFSSALLLTFASFFPTPSVTPDGKKGICWYWQYLIIAFGSISKEKRETNSFIKVSFATSKWSPSRRAGAKTA